MSISDIIAEIQEFEDVDSSFDEIADVVAVPIVQSATLPDDCINLNDPIQVGYFKDNKAVRAAIETIKRRKLDVAAHKPTFYISLTDYIHKNRLVIPFIDDDNQIVHYQTRTILDADNQTYPRYISKRGSEKTLFNFNLIDYNFDKVFIFEGPLNACFCKNGIAVAGIQENSSLLFTKRQSEQIQKIPFHTHTWVLDSQWIDSAALSKSKILADQNQQIFIWPEDLGRQYKDFNDLAIAFNVNEISTKFIEQNTFSGISAQIRLRAIR